MSHPGKFVKKHPWEAVGALAALGLGGAGLAGAGPLAGLLGEGTAAAVPAAGATLAGASGLTELAGATGAPLASTPSVGSGLLGGLNPNKAFMAKQGLGLLNQQPQRPPMGGGMPQSNASIQNTVLYPQAGPSSVGGSMNIPPEILNNPKLLQAYLAQMGGQA